MNHVMNIVDTITKSQLKLFTAKSYKAKQTLFKENDKCKYVGIVISGKIQIVSYLLDGKEIIYNTLLPNNLFGNNLLFSSDNCYKGDVLAIEDSEVLLIDKTNLLKLFNKNNEFFYQYMQMQADFTKDLNNRIKLLSIDSAKNRFLFYLQSKNGKVHYQSITNLAKELYLSREAFSRLLTVLIKENIIIKNNNYIILNRRK